VQHTMTDRKHKAHVRKETVACIKKTKIPDKHRSLQYWCSLYREDENQKIKGSQRKECGWGFGREDTWLKHHI